MDGPQSGIPFWQDKLNRGFRLTGVGGSDNHNASAEPGANSAIGHPTTVVYAENLSERAILEGVRAGHVFVDLEGTPNRLLEWTAQAAGKSYVMGDEIAAPAGETIHFTLKLSAVEAAHPEVILDGAATSLVSEAPISHEKEQRDFDYVSDGKRHWLRVNVRAQDGRLLLLGNPIYVNF